MTVVIDLEHASFSAHNAAGTSCEATGQIVYKTPVVAFTAKINELTIERLAVGQGAFFAATITKAERGPYAVGDVAG